MISSIDPRNDNEKSWLVRGTAYDNSITVSDIPIIETATDIPQSLISFSRCKKERDYSQWIHFYESDYRFAHLWTNPRQYERLLKQFCGIISPDFSICPDYPLPIQYYNKYRNHALAYWLSTRGIPVIPNVRWGDKHSYNFCFNGIEKNSVVAVGTHGQMKTTANRELFQSGLTVMVEALSPHTIIVYGKAPDDIFGRYKDAGIRVLPFPSETEKYHKQRKVVA